MKKLLATMFVAVTIFCATTPAFATQATSKNTERTTVTVGYLEDYGIINTPIVQGSEGYGYTYLEKLEEYTDYNFEYVAVSWADGLTQLKNGEIDLLAPASMSDERKEAYDFVDTVFLTEEINIYALDDSDYHYDEPQQLNGKVFGTFEGSVYEERFRAYAEAHGLDYTLKYTNHDTVAEDMRSGIVDFYVDGSLNLRGDVHSIGKIASEKLYIITQKGNDSLNTTMNSAMVALEEDEIHYNEILWHKYYANAQKAARKLTLDEIFTLQRKDIYTVGYHADLPPISYTSPDGTPKGYAIDVMNMLVDKLDITIRYVSLHDDEDNSPKDVDFNLCPMRDEGKLHGTLSEPYDRQNLLVVTEKGLAASDIKHILVPDYSTVEIDDFLKDYPSATLHKVHSSTDSQIISDTVDIDCKIIPESSELFIRNKANVSISVLDLFVPIGITVSNELPLEVLAALNKTILSLERSAVDEAILENVLALQAESALVDIVIQYRIQITFGLLLLATVFICFLLNSRNKAKQLLEVDTLTGTMTKYAFGKQAHRILSHAKSNEYMMILLDVDKFKTINKVYGTQMGDKLLCILADSLKQQTTKGAIVSRLQNDAFAILTKNNEISKVIRDEAFVNELKTAGIDMAVYFSVGVYVIEHTEENISYMLDNANIAKAYGKTIFGNTVHYFAKELQAKQEKENAILATMESAIENEEFFIVVQPKVELKTGRLVGGEVLIRWQKQDGTFVYPDEFIPLFEENKFIIHLDRYVLEKTCEFIRDSEQTLPVLSVNVSATTMLETDFLKIGSEILAQYGVAPQQLEVELTENVLDVDYERISNIVARLKKQGVSVAMDDFGKGASSLARIKEIEIDVLKLDKEFIVHNAENEKGKIILNSIITMANHLGITALAEGVETQEQQDLLIELGCEQGQGYYFDRPLSTADFIQRVEANAQLTFKPIVDALEHNDWAVAALQTEDHLKEERSKSMIVNLCINMLRTTTETTAVTAETATTVLELLRKHYQAKSCVIVHFSPKKQTCEIRCMNTALSDYPHWDVIRNSPYRMVDKILKRFEQSQYALLECETKKFFDTEEDRTAYEMLGIENGYLAPMFDINNDCNGMLLVTNPTLRTRSSMLVQIVAKFLSDYQVKREIYLDHKSKIAIEPMTGLLNKVATEDKIEQLLQTGQMGVLYMVDLDNFKRVNDTFGHAMGDKVVIEAAKKLRALFRKDDVIGRIGGDEFIIYAPDLMTENVILKKAEQIVNAFAKDDGENSITVQTTVSVGVCTAWRDGETFQHLYQAADTALYQAKEHGKNQFRLATQT